MYICGIYYTYDTVELYLIFLRFSSFSLSQYFYQICKVKSKTTSFTDIDNEEQAGENSCL